jgi:hypothetical protein
VILEAFAAALLRILRGSSSFERIHFMDGPYEVELRRASARELQIRALESGSIEKARADVPVSVVVADLLAAADAMLTVCHKAGEMSRDSERLEHAVQEMRAETSQRTN